MASDVLLRFAQAVVNQVIDNITQQLSALTNKVQNPLAEMIAPNLDNIWKGGSADEFRRQVQNILKADLEPSVNGIRQYQRGIHDASKVILDADRQVGQLVSDLTNDFNRIY